MNKKILIILGLIILLSFGAGAVLLMGKKKNQPQPSAETKLQISKLSDDQVVSPVVSYDGNAIWYFTEDARLFRVNTDGSGLSEFPLPELTAGDFRNVIWPATGNDFIAVTSTNTGELKSYYDNLNQRYVALPLNIQSLDWLPDGRRAAYIWKSGDNATQQLVIADADGTGFRIIKDVFWPDLAVKASPAGGEVLLIRSQSKEDNNKIYKANLTTGQFETVIGDGENTAIMWLPDGKKFLFSQNSGSASKVLLYNFETRTQTDLNLATTLDKVMTDKDGRYLYAAVANKNSPAGVSKGDEFVKIDLLSFHQETYFSPEEDIRARNLLQAAGTLYFVNTRDGKLYYISK